MTTVKKGLVVQTRIPVSSAGPDRRAADFLVGLKKALREGRKRYPPELFRLDELCLLPKDSFIGVKFIFSNKLEAIGRRSNQDG